MSLKQEQLEQVYIGVSGFLLSAVLDPDAAVIQFYGDHPAASIPSHFMAHLRAVCAEKYASLSEGELRPQLDLQAIDANLFCFFVRSRPTANYFSYRHQSVPCQNPMTEAMVTVATDTTDLGETLARHSDAGPAHPLSLVPVEAPTVDWIPWALHHGRLPTLSMCTILEYVREKFRGNEALERSALTGAFKRVTTSAPLTPTFAVNLPPSLYPQPNALLIRGVIPQSQNRG